MQTESSCHIKSAQFYRLTLTSEPVPDKYLAGHLAEHGLSEESICPHDDPVLLCDECALEMYNKRVVVCELIDLTAVDD